MDIIQQLKNIKYSSIIINTNLEMIENLKKQITYIKHCNESSKTIEKIALLESEINKSIDEMYDKNAFLVSLIDSLPDKERELLTAKYIQCKSWDEITQSMFISRRTAFRIHASAIEKLNDLVL